MPVVDRADEFAPQHVIDVAQVDHHSGVGVDRAADCDLDHVAVPMLVDVITECLAIPFVAPFRSAQHVGRSEGGAPRDAHVGGHGSILKFAPDSGADSGDASHTITRATSAGSSAGPATPEMRSIGVSTAPGLMALTRMPASRPSTASASVRPARPDLPAT